MPKCSKYQEDPIPLVAICPKCRAVDTLARTATITVTQKLGNFRMYPNPKGKGGVITYDPDEILEEIAVDHIECYKCTACGAEFETLDDLLDTD